MLIGDVVATHRRVCLWTCFIAARGVDKDKEYMAKPVIATMRATTRPLAEGRQVSGDGSRVESGKCYVLRWCRCDGCDGALLCPQQPAEVTVPSRSQF